DNVVIYCYSGSYAESFAISNEIPYVLLAPQYEIGDVNMNGQVEITDVTLLQQHLAEILTLSEDQLLLADMNQDGEADIGDATGIQFKIAGFLV
ncbi:MAG: dockerin type I repeat-containing protein, partial [Ruminococcus sp.]